jgi:hypothetical protein
MRFEQCLLQADRFRLAGGGDGAGVAAHRTLLT